MLDGWKTYLMVVAGCILAMIYGLGYIDETMFVMGLGIFGFGSVAGLRKAIKKMFEDFISEKK